MLRAYATLHIALMYAARVTSLPGLGSPLRRAVPEGWLEALGLLPAPSLAHTVAPAIGLLLLVRLPGCHCQFGWTLLLLIFVNGTCMLTCRKMRYCNAG